MAHTAAHRGTPPPTIESARDRERLRTVVFPEHSDLAAAVADRIVEVIQRETRAKGRVVLGLATGSTPLGVYEELIRRHQAGEVDFAHVITFNLDEYYPMGPESAHSYRRYMWENFFSPPGITTEKTPHPPPPPPHPGRHNAPRARGRVLRRVRCGDPDGGRYRLPAAGYRQDGAHRLQRAGLRCLDPHAHRHARHADAQRRRGRFLRRRERAARGDHHGRRHDSRR